AAYDELGRVVRTAVMGKAGSSDGDTLDDPTARFEHSIFRWDTDAKPNFIHTFAREKHGDANPRWQESYVYSDGSGHVAMTKMQAEEARWVGTGRTVLDNKGNPIKQYEPYFSETFEYEDEPEI